MSRDHQVIRVAVRAVDVGYFNTKLTLGRKAQGESSVIATHMFPSLAPLLTADAMKASDSLQTLNGCVVDVDGARYFVGKDAAHHTSALEPRPVLDNYSISPKYLALLRGALASIAEDAGAGPGDECVIAHLVIGLPLNTFLQHHAVVAERARGEHVVGVPGSNARRVTVENVSVVPQPRGAFLDHAVSCGGHLDGWTLVVDPGGGTLDWFLASKVKANYARSGAYPKAMLACAYAVADEIDPKWRDNLVVIERIDHAIRVGASSFRAGGVEHDLSTHKAKVNAVIEEAVTKMLAMVGDTADLDLILVTGGGAKVFHDYLLATRPSLAPLLRTEPDPIFSNVRGFQIFGEVKMARPQTR
jgi:plasmid segregation protein ParM